MKTIICDIVKDVVKESNYMNLIYALRNAGIPFDVLLMGYADRETGKSI